MKTRTEFKEFDKRLFDINTQCCFCRCELEDSTSGSPWWLTWCTGKDIYAKGRLCQPCAELVGGKRQPKGVLRKWLIAWLVR